MITWIRRHAGGLGAGLLNFVIYWTLYWLWDNPYAPLIIVIPAGFYLGWVSGEWDYHREWLRKQSEKQ